MERNCQELSPYFWYVCGQTSSFTLKYFLSTVIVADLDIVVADIVPNPGVKVGIPFYSKKYYLATLKFSNYG